MTAYIRRLTYRLAIAQKRRDLIGAMGLERQIKAALAS